MHWKNKKLNLFNFYFASFCMHIFLKENLNAELSKIYLTKLCKISK